MAAYPELVKEAATTFQNECVAFLSLDYKDGIFKVNVQAPLLALQFGDAGLTDGFGRNPTGLLFYNQVGDLQRNKFEYYRDVRDDKIFIINFFEVVDDNETPRILAKFITRHGKVPLPKSGGYRNWSIYHVAIAPAVIIKNSENSTTTHLLFYPIRKRVIFHSSHVGVISRKPGLLIFKDIAKLLDSAVDGMGVSASIPVGPIDRILFRTKERETVALFLPNEPIGDAPMTASSITTWKHLDPLEFSDSSDLEADT